MKNIWKAILFLCLPTIVCSGCVWPGFTAPKGNVTVTTDPSAVPTTQKNGHAYIPRLIVLQYWCNQEPASIELVKAFAMDTNTSTVEFPLRMYTVFWTPALGAQHIDPEPEIVVFASGYWPVSSSGDGRNRCCCAPPRKEPCQYQVSLKPDTGTPPQRCPGTGNDTSPNFSPLLFHLDSLDTALSLGKGITPADKLMVYRQMRKQAIVWQEQFKKGQVVTDAKEINDVIEGLDKRIAKFKGRRQRNKDID